MSRRADILMITYLSSGYVHLSLPRLLDTCGPHDRVWLWHNGDDEATIEALRPYLADPRLERYHHSRKNALLRPPTRWLWAESSAEYLSKVDDDCLVAPGWLDVFAEAHAANPDFGVVGSWRHSPEDYREDLAGRKIRTFRGGHRLMINPWVQGSGYLLRRRIVEAVGPIGDEESFTAWCLRLARTGAVNGYYFPFVPEDHMDDPRSPNTLIRTDADLWARMPLSAQANGVTTVEEWTSQLRRSALVLQEASPDPSAHMGWRRRVTSTRRRLSILAGRSARW